MERRRFLAIVLIAATGGTFSGSSSDLSDESESAQSRRTEARPPSGSSRNGSRARSPTPHPTAAETPTATPTATPVPARTHYGIEFPTVFDAVEDLGVDPTGKKSVDSAVKSAAADDTLIEFPPGTYLWEREHDFIGHTNFGIRSTTGDPDDVTFVFPKGFSGVFLAVREKSKNVLLEGFEVAQSDDRSTGAGIVVRAVDGAEVRNLRFSGFSPSHEPSNQLYTTIETVDGVGTIDNVTIDGGGVIDTYPNRMVGIFGGTPHTGELRISNCDIRELGSSGIRYTGSTGAVKVEDCYFENIDNGALRVHGNEHADGKQSWVKRCEFVNDDSLLAHLPADESYENADMVRVDDAGNGYQGLLIEECTFKYLSHPDGTTSRGCISRPGWSDHGGFTVRGCTMQIDADGPEAIDASGSSDTVENTVTVADTHISGSTEQSDTGSVIYIVDSNESVVRNCCISVPAMAHGIRFENSARCTVSDSDISVANRATVAVDSTVSTIDITEEGACRRPGDDSATR